MRYDVDAIKRVVSCRELLALNGIETNSKNKARCIFHDDSHASMHVYSDGYKCFSCDAHGDVIDLARQLYSVSFNDACRILAEQNGIQPTQDDSFRQRIDEQRRKRQDHAERIKRLRNEYFRIVSEYRRLDNNRSRYAPRSPTEPLHPLFIEALDKIDAVADDMQRAEWAWHDAEQENY